tara:strand:+ start:834 stop:1409 length:576 start_codon:yes stop_codon:yes gene_type:complete
MEFENLSNIIKVKYIRNLIDEIRTKSDTISSEESLKQLESKNKILLSILDEKIKDSKKKSITSNSKSFNNLKSVNILQSSDTIDLNVKENKIEENNNEQTEKSNEYSDDYLYKKPWTKLANIHKIIKVKEFVNKLIINTEESREKLKDSLIELINKKILTKKDMVKYDVTHGRIIGIPKLTFKDGKYYFMM